MSKAPIDFIHSLDFADLPSEVVALGQRCLIDLVGVAAAGRRTELSRIVRDHAARQFGAGEASARLLFDGRRVSPSGAALANGMTIDAIDAHDGHPLTKGHIGCGVLAALLAYGDAQGAGDGRAFLTALVLGYEFGARAGIALHAGAADYHTSGAWVALACAALGARALGLDPERTDHALGIAEYHGPRSQMMRCIDHPTMIKDGSGWGAMAGVSAAYLAADGFTGAPAVTLERDAPAETWSDLGSRWRILEQYFKPYPVCRWAQPAVEAALQVQRDNDVVATQIARIEVTSFHEALRLGARAPADTEAAQYSLPFPVATAVVKGRIGFEEISGAGLHDPAVLTLAQSMELKESEAYNARFPAERWAEVTLLLADGRRLTSAPAVARGNAENPLGDHEIGTKYRALSEPLLGVERSARIAAQVAGLAESGSDAGALLDSLAEPAAAQSQAA
jgi:2-methylcitrate dehydratase PrpD